MAVSPFAPLVGVGDTSIGKSRFMQETPHGDGLRFVGAGSLNVSAPTAPVLTRTAAGVWVLSRTAAVAETLYFRTTLADLLRTGEAYQFGAFGGPSVGYSAPPYPPKGIGIINMFAVLQIGVVALTSATLRLGKTVYSANLAPVQTDILAATALGSLAVSNPATTLVQVIPIPVNAQTYFTDDFSLPEIELAVVMANTGTLAVAGIGAHVAFNYN